MKIIIFYLCLFAILDIKCVKIELIPVENTEVYDSLTGKFNIFNKSKNQTTYGTDKYNPFYLWTLVGDLKVNPQFLFINFQTSTQTSGIISTNLDSKCACDQIVKLKISNPYPYCIVKYYKKNGKYYQKTLIRKKFNFKDISADIEFQEIVKFNYDSRVFPFSGTISLGLTPSGNEFLNNLLETQQIAQPIFSYYSKRDSSINSPFINFGEVESKAFQGKIKYYQIISQNFYMIEIDKIKIENFSFYKNKKVLFEIELRTIQASENLLSQIKSKLKILNDDCESTDLLPTIFFVFKSNVYSLDGHDYTRENEKKECKLLFGKVQKNKLEQINQDQILILGNLFMAKYYTVFDLKEKKIGLAISK